MKLFNKTNIFIPSRLNFKIMVLSDIHFSNLITDELLNSIIYRVKEENAKYLLIAGDLVDSLNMVRDSVDRERLIGFLKELSLLCKVIIGLGNHDLVKTVKIDGKTKWVQGDYKEFWSYINNLQNIYVVDNLNYEDDFVKITGLTQDYSYYYNFDKRVEKDYKTLESLLIDNREILSKVDGKINILLIHSPVFLNNKNIKELVEEYDYIITGHMHNGCVPPLLRELWVSSRGLISPNKKLFTDMARNIIDSKNNILVNGPITTFQECSGFMNYFNIFYPHYYSVLDFGNYEKIFHKSLYIKK